MKTLSIWNEFSQFTEIPFIDASKTLKICISNSWTLSINSDETFTYVDSSAKSIPSPISVCFTISQISCNSTLALLLSKQNDIWVMGEDPKKTGLFGQEEVFQSNVPKKIGKFSDHLLTNISLSESHAAAICAEGFLYTWGSGKQGELCSDSEKILRPTLVESSSIFRINQVVCGVNYTAICTKAGYLYIYGNNHQLKTSGAYSSPFTFACLEHHFIEKIYDSRFGIVILTLEGKCFVLENSEHLTALESSRKIKQVAVCDFGIAGLSTNKTKILYWLKSQNSWVSKILVLNSGSVEKIESALGNGIGVFANDFNPLQTHIIDADRSYEGLYPRTYDSDREYFNKIYKSIDNTYIRIPIIFQVEGFKKLKIITKKIKATAFASIKEHASRVVILRKAYAFSISAKSIVVAVRRINLTQKSFAFGQIKDFSVTSESQNQQLKLRVKIILKINEILKKKLIRYVLRGVTFALLREKEIKCRITHKIWPILNRLARKNMKKALLNIFCKGNRLFFLDYRVTEVKKKLLTRIYKLYQYLSKINKDIKQEKKLKAAKQLGNFHPLSNRNFAFSLWRECIDLNKRKCLNIKISAAALFASIIEKHLKKRYSLFVSLYKSRKSVYHIKYGAFMFFSTMSKIVSKIKAHSFNSIFRSRFRSHTDLFCESIKRVYHRHLNGYFNHIRLYTLSKYNRKLVYFALYLQRFRERSKYISVLQGLNAFKMNYLNKSVLSQRTSDKTYLSFEIVVTPPPMNRESLEQQPEEPLVKSKSGDNLDRRLSLHTFQQSLIKKFSDKISQGSKSEFINDKARLIPAKTISKQSVKEKRSLYAEQLKERQKNKLKKNNEGIIMKKKVETRSLFDEEDRKIIKYRNSFGTLSGLITTLVKSRMGMAMELIKSVKKIREHKVLVNNNVVNPAKAMEKISTPRLRPKRTKEIQKKSPVKPVHPPQFEQSSWKTKLMSLGLNKFSRVIKLNLSRVFKQLYK